MSWEWINPFNKVVGLVSEFVEDPDKKNELDNALQQLKENVYLAELQTKTIPWIDGLHKMGRQLLSWGSLLVPAILLYHNPDIDPMQLAAMTGPAGLYNYMKGKGK